MLYLENEQQSYFTGCVFVVQIGLKKLVLLLFSMLHVLESVSVLFSPSMCLDDMSRDVRKLDFCICENKDADQLRGNREADQRLCFRYTDSTIPLLSKSEISSF